MNIAALRLYSQRLSETEFTTPHAVVQHMGAMQAQDYAMSKWAVGIRIPGSVEQAIDDAMSKGTIIRTHVMRPTWHLVAAEDVHWMLELTAPAIRTSMKARHNELELTPEVLKKACQLFEKALKGGQNLTREALMEPLLKIGIKSDNNRSSHVLMWAELEGLLCSGAPQGNKQTYALLNERVPKKPKAISREEALRELAERYFTSHGPATLADFNWWSGLPVKDARSALESVKKQLLSESIEGEIYWFTEKTASHPNAAGTFLLPAFDELIISYKNRSAALASEHHSKAVSINGIFRPVILVNGIAKGLWKRTVKKDDVFIETNLFGKLTAQEEKAVAEAAEQFGTFLGKTVKP